MANTNGSNGNDVLNGTAGVDQIYGHGGDDVIYGHNGDDTIYGGAGNDELYGGEGNDTLGGGAGDDVIYGGAGDDKIYGGAGNDILYGGAGNDKIYGGEGNDTVSYADYVSEDGEKGVFVDLDNNSQQNKTGDTYYSIENIIGSQYNDTIYGDAGDNIIWGHGGNDTLYGYSYQAYGEDSSGFFGNDIFYTGSRVGDVVKVYLGLGNDTVYGGDGDERIECSVSWHMEDYVTYGREIGKKNLYLGEGNNHVFLDAFGEFDITSGSGDDYILLTRGSFQENSVTQATAKAMVNAGDGNNFVAFRGDLTMGNITTGSGNDEVYIFQDSRIFDWSAYEGGWEDTKINVGNGDNRITFNGIFMSSDIRAGDGNDNIWVHQSMPSYDIASDDMTLYDCGKLFANVKIDAGRGENDINVNGELMDVDIITGNHNDRIHLFFGYYSLNEIGYKGDLGRTYVNAGDGNNDIDIGGINYNIVNVVTGDGDDMISLSEYSYDGMTPEWQKEDYVSERILHTGSGDDRVSLNNLNYFEVNTGSESDEITVYGGSHLNIYAATGHDNLYIYNNDESFIDMGTGNDIITLKDINNCIIKGGQGKDTYIIQNFSENTANIIDNYDIDGAADILKLGSVIGDYTAIFDGNDLVISSGGGTLNLQNYALGSDYQLAEVHIGETIYTSEQFLAEMGLSL